MQYLNPCYRRNIPFEMKKSKIIILLVICSFLVFAFIPKKINVIYQNSIQTKVLNVELFLDDEKIEDNEVVYSYFTPLKSSRLNVNSGYHIVKITCDDLEIEKSVKILTFFQNYIEFEFVGHKEEGFKVITRDSWFPLVYE